jgi:hypothetical protein
MKSATKTLIGLLSTLLLSTIILFVYYGELLKAPNTKYFSNSGDGLKTYYVGTYHIKYDSTYFRSQGMNYPYGESIFFVDGHPLIANSIKFISNNITDISDYFVGTINMLMLVSLVIACLFVFLIFIELGLPSLYSVIPAIAIVFLSPQVDRMGGHFSFSYHFVLPLIIYLLLRFFKKQGFLVSFFIAFLLFFGLTSHQYLFAFCSVFLLALWIFIIVNKSITFKKGILLFSIQFLLPLVVYALILMSSTDVKDRTSHPWGFMYYRAYPESVFLPFGKPYGSILYKIFTSLNYMDWEAYAYIGLVAVIGFGFFLKRIVVSIYHKHFKEIIFLTDNSVLNLFFWASFLALLYSFGIPYILKMEFLLDYIGVLRQMRGIARFAWLFYYMMNILVFYWIYKWTEKNKSISVKSIVIILAFGMIVYDAWTFNRGRQYLYNKEIPELARDYQPPWLKSIESNKYQAIIPIPYFNIGSENLWIDSHTCSSLKSTFIVSQKTGLPTNGVMLSRTSISQSYKNIQLTLEPYRIPVVLNDCKSKKPFLLVVNNCETYTENEKKLISISNFIDSSSNFRLFEISYESLFHISDSLYLNTLKEITSRNLFRHNEFMSSNDTLDFTCMNFDDIESPDTYSGKGSFEGLISNWNTIFYDTIPNFKAQQEYIASFWYGNISTDVQLRTNLILAYYDEKGNSIREDWLGLLPAVKILDNNWALCEVKFKMDNPKGRFKIKLKNDQIRKGKILVDEVLIRPSKTDIYFQSEGKIIKNNRTYFKEQKQL